MTEPDDQDEWRAALRSQIRAQARADQQRMLALVLLAAAVVFVAAVAAALMYF